MNNAEVICARLERITGLRLSVHQRRALPTALAQLALEVNLEPSVLEARLLDDPDLLERLAQSFTVPETFFGRVAAQVDALRQVVLPALSFSRSEARALRVWCAGCSTGEEAYTLAALLEQAGVFLGWDAQILASDLNRVSLEVAREGVYATRAFRAEGEAFKRFAQPEGQSWRMLERLRNRLRFVQHNLLGSDWPVAPGSQDLIVCRNVSIYFSPERAFEVYARFHESLADGGWLVLGPSDPQHGLDARGFEAVSAPGAVIWRKRFTVIAPMAKPALTPKPEVRSERKLEPVITPMLETPRPETPRPETPLPESVVARQAGLQALETSDTHAALEHLRRATFLAPQDALAHFGLGRAWWKLGETRRAKTAWALAKRLWLQNELEPVTDETSRWLHAVDQLLSYTETSSVGGVR
jgi:chemotaxis protein methyltransferase CheR